MSIEYTAHVHFDEWYFYFISVLSYIILEKSCDMYTRQINFFKRSWSTRGKLRNLLLPLLKDVYGDGSMSNLSHLATESDAARDLLVETTMQPFFEAVQSYGPMGFVFQTTPWKNQSLFFWKFVLKDLLHSFGRGMFSDKSVVSFLTRVQVEKITPGWLQCRKDYAVFLEGDGRVFVFHPESYPWSKKDQYNVAGTCKFCQIMTVSLCLIISRLTNYVSCPLY